MDLQTAYALLYLEINVVSFMIVAIIQFKTEGISKMVAQRNFSMAIGLEMLFIVSDTLYVMMQWGILPYCEGLMVALCTVYFLSTTMMCFAWFTYFEWLQDSPFVKSRARVLASSLLVWIMAAALIANLSTGMLFYIEDGAYHRGRLFLLQYLLPYVYVLFSSFRALLGVFDRKLYAKRGLLLSLALFPIAPAVAGVLQYRYPELPLVCSVLSISTLLLYLEWTDQIISVDPLTRLNNRKQLLHKYEQWCRGSDADTPIHLLIIDANKFKGINDTYGHIQGDAALVRIAEALRLACREFPHRTTIARYGGDEFVVLAFSDDAASVEALRARVNVILRELNDAAQAPYELSVSIGAARADASKGLRELIEEADAQLYKEKRSRV